MTRCPICNAEAAEIDRGLLDGVGFDCKFHGRFRVVTGRPRRVKRAPRHGGRCHAYTEKMQRSRR